MGRSGARLPGQETSGSFGPDYVHNGGRPTSSHVNQKEKYILKASQSTVQRRVLSTKGQSCLSAAELVMGHPRNPTAYYLASTLLAYRRLRPKSVHTCSCRCEHKGFAVSTQLLRLHLPVKCEQRILNQRSPRTISVSKHRSDSAHSCSRRPQNRGVIFSLSA